MTDPSRCPPIPIGKTSTKLLVIEHTLDAVRIFRKGRKPLGFWRNSDPPGNRFDPLGKPYQRTEVLYAGEQLETAIAETLIRWHDDVEPGEKVIFSEKGDLSPRRFVNFKARRKLNIIDASGAGMKRIQEVLAEVAPTAAPVMAEGIFDCHSDEYPRTQRWCAWFRKQAPDADGLRWTSRQFNRGQCLVLFKDRCARDLVKDGKPLPLYAPGSESRALVDQMIADFGWGVGP